MGRSEQVDKSSKGSEAEQSRPGEVPYPLTMQRLNTGQYCAEIPDLPGCRSVGETMEEALANVLKESETWIKEAKMQGEQIPQAVAEPAAAWVVLPLSQGMFVSYTTRARRRGMNLADILMEALDSYHARI